MEPLSPKWARGYFGLQRESYLYPGRTLREVVEDVTTQNLQLPISEGELARLTKSAYEYELKRLKENKDSDGLSSFDYLILTRMGMIIGKPVGELRNIALGVRNLEANPAMAQHSNFPTLHAKAKSKVQEELRSRVSDPKILVSYLVELSVNKFASQLAKDYKQACDALGSTRAVNYASCLLELRLLQTDTTVNESVFKRTLLNSMAASTPIDILHIKSLRYTYLQRSPTI